MRSSVVIPLFWLLLAFSTGLTGYSDLVEYAQVSDHAPQGRNHNLIATAPIGLNMIIAQLGHFVGCNEGEVALILLLLF